MKGAAERGNVWSIILAGGNGMRTKEFLRRWLSYEKPKQYCTLVGSRSMFQHTLDRAARLTPWERVAVVAARHHQDEVWLQLDGRPIGSVVLQPKNADTAAGIYLPLTYILARDPQATVVVYPSDHFIYPEDLFLSAVDQAIQGSTVLGGRPVLLGAKPDSLELDYGWIKPGRALGRAGKAAIQAVDAFFDKPDETIVRKARAAGSLWNTLVFAAKGQELWTCFSARRTGSRSWKCGMSSGVTGEIRSVSCRASRGSGNDRRLRKTRSPSCTWDEGPVGTFLRRREMKP
jgi:mannose-1-phosphate guanylyltransferase